MPKSDFYYLDQELMEKICHPLAVTFLNRTNEPIPIFCTCNNSVLDSCLKLPQLVFNGQELYPDLVSKAVILYYSIIKNHPFVNGNKRIATTSLAVFLYINNFWLEAGQNFLYELALEVAKSEAGNADDVKRRIIEKIRPHVVPLIISGDKPKGNVGFLFNIKNLKNNFKKIIQWRK